MYLSWQEEQEQIRNRIMGATEWIATGHPTCAVTMESNPEQWRSLTEQSGDAVKLSWWARNQIAALIVPLVMHILEEKRRQWHEEYKRGLT